ncbi:MAG: hypothetical protein HZC37_12470 [Burkholderiales bacterium]|nr:hypothetical protein [Burkholderiales bacterium]
MTTPGEPGAVLARVLHALRPLVRLLVHHGITYAALAAALKRLFLDEAKRELQRRGMPVTDSALTLLSGVHRRDVRTLTREPRHAAAAAQETPAQRSLASEVVGRWMHERRFLDRAGHPRVLPRGKAGAGERGTFDDLVEGISRDVRPRAVLDELQRLGVAEEGEAGVRLLAEGFAPRRGADEMAELFAANVHDHAAAAVANLRGEANFLEQAVFVDEIGADSVRQLSQAGAAAWKVAMREVMSVAQQRFDLDRKALPADQRRQRARFGVYFFSEAQE